MTQADPNVHRIEVVARALGDLRDELVLVGGCAVGLLIDSPTAPPPRVTYDVDLIAEAAAIHAYHALEESLAARGFVRDRSADAPICRWVIGAVKLDLVPTTDAVLGFSNRWYPEAMQSSRRCALPSGIHINLISPPAFIATKFEAFDTRGGGDMLSSHDFEDIINMFEGCSSLVSDIDAASPPLREYLVKRISAILGDQRIGNILPGLIAQDELHQQRTAAVRERLFRVAALLR